MAKTYEEYEEEQLRKAEQQAAAYEQQVRAQANQAAEQIDSTYATAKQAAEKQYNEAAKDTAASYREVYDANAVDELVARRNATEALTNMGLRNSGLNTTQQTAISLSRSRADAKTTAQKQAAVDAIMRELDALRAQYDSEAATQKASVHSAADDDVRQNLYTLYSAARQNAATLYGADQERAAAEYAAQQERAAAEYTARQEAQTAAAQQQMDMLKLGYQYDPETGGYTYVGTAEQQLAAEQAAYDRQVDMLKLGYQYDPETDKYMYVGTPGSGNNSTDGMTEYEKQQLVLRYQTELGMSYEEAHSRVYGTRVAEQFDSTLLDKTQWAINHFNKKSGEGSEYVSYKQYVAAQIEKAYDNGHGTLSETDVLTLLEKYGITGG